MNIFHQQFNFWPWYFRVMATFMRVRALTTLMVIVSSIAVQITKLLSSLLPIKVILLAGSEGVPRYFAFFISPDEKAGWIIGLSIATVGFFIATSLLENFLKRLAQLVGDKAMGSANELFVISGQEDKVRSYYLSMCNTIAFLIFSALAIIVLYYINFNLFIFLVAAIFIQFLITAWGLSGDNDINPGPFKTHILYESSNYIILLKTFNFLVGFFIILYPFLVGVDYNILLAIISMVLLRQTLSMLGSVINNNIGLSKASHNINMLVFKDSQLESREKSTSVALRDVFPLSERERMAAQHLVVEDNDIHISSEWQDSSIPAAKTFKISKSADGQGVKYYQQQVFPVNKAVRIQNEDYIFGIIPREKLWAPPLVTSFKENKFECRIFDYGDGCVISLDSWKDVEDLINKHIWSITPPESLIDAYSSSKPILSNRIKKEFILRVEVAIDNDEESGVVTQFISDLPALRKYLDVQPVCIYNPDIIPANITWCEVNNRPIIMTWARWHIEPIGALLPKKMDNEELLHLLDGVKLVRKDIPEAMSINDLLFINKCYLMEKAIRGERFKAAIDYMREICSYKNVYSKEERRFLSKAK